MRPTKPRAKPVNRRPIKRSGVCNTIPTDVNQVQNAHQYATTQVDLGDCTDSDHILCCILALQLALYHKDVIKYENGPHITVRYGLHDTLGLADHVIKMLCNTGPISCIVGDLSIFKVMKRDSQGNITQFDVLKLAVRSMDLKSLNTTLGLLPNHQDFEYDPHITVAYLGSGLGSKYLSMSNKLRNQWLVFDQLRFKTKDKVETIIPLATTHNANPLHANQPRSWMGRYVLPTGIPRHRVVKGTDGNTVISAIDMSDQLSHGSGVKQYKWNTQQRDEIMSLLKERLISEQDRIEEINARLTELCKVS